MANWMTAEETYDNALVLYERLAGLFLGIWVAAGVCRRWPSTSGWLSILGVLFGFVFLTLAAFRSKSLSQTSAEVQSE